MSTQARATQFADLLKGFFALKPDDFFKSGPVYNDYDGPNVQEARDTYEFLKGLYEPLLETGHLNKLPWTAINGLQGQAQNVLNMYNQLLSSRDQGSFQNFSINLDSFAYHTRMFGVPYIAAGGDVVDATRASMSRELEVLTTNNREVDALKKDIRTLIAPAVAGSLSKSFSERRDSLMIGRVVWLVVTLVLGISVIYATYAFANSISDAMIQSQAITGQAEQSLWPVIAIRSIVLLPLFAAFGFAFSQYRKERDFEEEYAHKAAVAVSLPNYGDLTREPSVRDQIVTGATSVIFSSPTLRAKETEKSDAVIGGVREIVESLGKAFGRK
jgi:hypothetical protein